MPQLDFDGANSKVSADKIQGQSGTTVTIPTGHKIAGTDANSITINGVNAVAVAPSTSGNVLTSTGSAWASSTAAAGGAWNVIESQNVTTSVHSVDFTTGIDSTYAQYCFVISNLTANANCDFAIRVKDTGSASFRTDDYQYFTNRDDSASTISYVASTQDTKLIIGDDSIKVSMRVWLADPSDTANYKHLSWEGAHQDANGYTQINTGGGANRRTAAITGVQFTYGNASHNMVSGRITMYGLAHA